MVYPARGEKFSRYGKKYKNLYPVGFAEKLSEDRSLLTGYTGNMKKIPFALLRIFEALENTPLSLGVWAITFAGLIAVRLTIDLTVETNLSLSFFQLFFQWAHLFLFFLFSYLLVLPLVQVIARTTIEKAARVLLFGFLLILLAPIIDKLIFGDSLYWSFYIFDSLPNMLSRFLTYFGDKPHLGITYGTRINVALILLSVFLYGWVKTRTFWRTLLYTLLIYTALFFLGTLPSWLAYIILSPHIPLLAITDTHIAEIFLSPETILNREAFDLRSALAYKMSLILILLNFALVLGYWYRLRKNEWLAFLKNARFPQIVCQNGVLLLGMLLAIIYAEAQLPKSFFSFLALLVLLLSVTAAWIASVLWNDIYDQKTDAKSNVSRPLISGIVSPGEYNVYALLLFFFSIFGAALVSFHAALFLIAFQALATLYSVPPFRLKRFLGIATLTASGAGIVILLTGYSTLQPNHSLEGLPLSLIVYLGISYLLMLPIKDFKDVTGDTADHIYTLPVVLGVERAKVVMSTISFLVFMSSIFVFHTPELLLWAFLFGSLSFWLIQRAGKPKSRIAYRDLMALFVTLAFCYGAGLILFLL